MKWEMKNFKIPEDGPIIEHLQLFRTRDIRGFYLGVTIVFPLPEAGILGGILA